MSFVLAPHEPVHAEDGAVFVRALRAFVLGSRESEENGGGADCHSQTHGHWIVDSPIANPMSGYAAYKSSRKSWGIDVLGTVVAEVELSNGMLGHGVSVGGAPAAFLIENHLSRFVEGQDPRNVELLWDQMWRCTVNYGRKGLPVQAISAVDLALWDSLGKLRGEPVYMLLGGKTKARLPVYATSTRPDLSQKLGFCGAKVPLPYGPGDGDVGMRRNIEHLQELRRSVEPDFPLMVDCYMSLTVPYAIELARRIDREVPGGVKWLEECLMPDDYKGYAELRAKVGSLVMITCGEHEYTRYGFRQLLEQGCVDLLQPDVTWCGGLTEARRICALASAFDIPVVPHGSSVYSFHLQLSQPNSPMAECLIMSPAADSIVPYFGRLFTDEPLPRDGYVELDASKPGFGVTLNWDALDLRRPYARPDAVDPCEDLKHRRAPAQELWLESASKHRPPIQSP